LCVDIAKDDFKAGFIIAYRPPYYTPIDTTYSLQLADPMSRLSIVKWPCFVVGDMNCPDICWINSTCPADGVQDVIVQAVNENGYIQLVNEPTRASSILGVVLTTDPLLVSELCVQCPAGNSDHYFVYFCLIHKSAL
jgi:hypothetical protein